MGNTITIEEFHKLEIRVGEILSAERVPETDRLLKLSVNFGEEKPRQVISGIAEHFPNPEDLSGKKCFFATNLEPRAIKGLQSEAMVLAVGGKEETFSLVVPENSDVLPGSQVH